MEIIQKEILWNRLDLPRPNLSSDTLLADFFISTGAGRSGLKIGCAWMKEETLKIRICFCESNDQKDMAFKAFAESAVHFETILTGTAKKAENSILNGECSSEKYRSFLRRDVADAGVYAQNKDAGSDPDAAAWMPVTGHSQTENHLYRLLSEKQIIFLNEQLNPYRHVLHIAPGGLKEWEAYLGLTQDKIYPCLSGNAACLNHDSFREKNDAEQAILKMISLASLTSLLSLDLLFHSPAVTEVNLRTETDYDGNIRSVLEMDLCMTCALPRPVTVLKNGIFLHASDRTAILKVPVYDGYLRYYYPDYENYWYFPAEDMAIHKNLAQYADQAYRVKASAQTAYTRISTRTVPEWSGEQKEEYCRNVLQILLI